MLAGSIEFITVPIRASHAVEEFDVDIAVVPAPDALLETHWKVATVADGKASVLVGPLAAGSYRVFVRIHASPETPVLSAGRLAVTQ